MVPFDTPFDAQIVGVGEADEDLFEVVTNDALALRLSRRRTALAQAWHHADSRHFWLGDMKDSPTRLAAEKRFANKEGRLPDYSKEDDWSLLLRYVLEDLETDDEWIFRRTGIRQRRFVREGFATSDIAVSAAKSAMESAGLVPGDIDGIFLATVTPDHPQTPPTSAIISDALGIPTLDEFGHLRQVVFLDCSDACSSFLIALQNTCFSIMVGQCRRVLVIGADTMSTVVSQFSRNLLPIFGDGAGALVLERTEQVGDPNFRPEWFFSYLDGSLANLIKTPAGGSRMPIKSHHLNPLDQRHKMVMDGRAITKAVSRLLLPCQSHKKPLATVIPSALEYAGFPMKTLEDFRIAINSHGVFGFHQANGRMVVGDLEKRLVETGYVGSFLDNIETRANTTSASIPLLLVDGVKKGALSRGAMVMLVVFGGGFTVATMRFRWTL